MQTEERPDQKNWLAVAKFLYYMMTNIMPYGNAQEVLMTLISNYQERALSSRKRAESAEKSELSMSQTLRQSLALIRREFKSNTQVFYSCVQGFLPGASLGAFVFCLISAPLSFSSNVIVKMYQKMTGVPHTDSETGVMMLFVCAAFICTSGLATSILALRSELAKRNLLVRIAVGGQSAESYLKLVDFCQIMMMFFPDIGQRNFKYYELENFDMAKLKEKASEMTREFAMWILKAEQYNDRDTNADLPIARSVLIRILRWFYLIGLFDSDGAGSWYDSARAGLRKKLVLGENEDLSIIANRFLLEKLPPCPFNESWPERVGD